uniref:SAM-dependent MTase TRM10-type domain-containing protein n=1 Tax=Steinernema glaseri TaxID=37863 RepID=A0A1I8AUZ1_9BILA
MNPLYPADEFPEVDAIRNLLSPLNFSPLTVAEFIHHPRQAMFSLITTRCLLELVRLIRSDKKRYYQRCPWSPSCISIPSFPLRQDLLLKPSTQTSSKRGPAKLPLTIHSTCSVIEVAEANQKKMTSKLLPSAAFLSKIVKPNSKKFVNKVMKEVEIFEYMGTKVPSTLSDSQWLELLKMPTLPERVSYLEFIAIKERKAERDATKPRGAKEEYQMKLEEQRRLYNEGGMGYGPDMYQLLSNPLRMKKRISHIESNRLLESVRTGVPEVVVDLQHFSNMPAHARNRMGLQLQYCISENFASRRPLPLSFYGYSMKKSEDVKFIEKCVGYYNTEYQNQIVLPEFHDGPVADLKKSGKRVVYISSASRRVLDGPLKDDVYILCAAKDLGRSALASSRINNIPAYSLPIKRYVKWESGPQFLPLNNTMRILREVYLNNGDWSSALHKNISQRHLLSHEERMEKNEIHMKKQNEKKRQRDELLELIRDGVRGL